MDKTVYLIRHGESEHNIAPVFQAPDSPLSKRGIRQAENVAERAEGLSFETLISSPLPRTKETAEAIARRTGKQVDYSDLFVERITPTSIHGKPYTDAVANDVWREWDRSLWTPGLRVEDGENFGDIVARADKALDYLRDRPETSMVVVTHAYFLRTMIARLLIGDFLTAEIFREFQKGVSMENTGITVLRYHGGFEQDPRWHLWTYNDHAHLAP